MDVFAHALWTNAAFYNRRSAGGRQRFIAVLFGLLPDLAAFAPAFFFMIFSGSFGPQAFVSDAWVFRFAEQAYNFTHSLVVFAVVTGLVALWRRGRIYWPMAAWALHILIDIPSHRGFYETPFLFPLSDYRFSHGVAWSNPVFMAVNYSLLALIYLFWLLVLRRRSAGKA